MKLSNFFIILYFYILFIINYITSLFFFDSYKYSYFSIAIILFSIISQVLYEWYKKSTLISSLNIFFIFFIGNYLIYSFLMADLNNLPDLQFINSWNNEKLNNALVIVHLALISVFTGYYLFSNIVKDNWVDRINCYLINKKKLNKIVIVYITLSILICILFIIKVGGFHYIFNMANIRVSPDFLGSGIYHIPMSILANVAAFFSLALESRKTKIIIVVVAVFINYLTASRLNVALLVISLIIISYSLHPYRITISKIILFTIMVLFLGPFLLALRGGYGSNISNNSIFDVISVAENLLQESKLGESLLGIIGHGNGINAVMEIVSKLDSNGDYKFGLYFLQSQVGWIPHAIWPNRPLSGSHLMNDYFWPGYVLDTGAPASSGIGDIYWDFGVFGVFILYFLIGNIHRYTNYIFRRSSNNIYISVICSLIVMNAAIYINETFINAFGLFLIYSIFFAPVYYYTRIKINK